MDSPEPATVGPSAPSNGNDDLGIRPCNPLLESDESEEGHVPNHSQTTTPILRCSRQVCPVPQGIQGVKWFVPVVFK